MREFGRVVRRLDDVGRLGVAGASDHNGVRHLRRVRVNLYAKVNLSERTRERERARGRERVAWSV
jgi:hypothetical protein